jgi:hypothetical protein
MCSTSCSWNGPDFEIGLDGEGGLHSEGVCCGIGGHQIELLENAHESEVHFLPCELTSLHDFVSL